jgi:hypothetical protein
MKKKLSEFLNWWRWFQHSRKSFAVAAILVLLGLLIWQKLPYISVHVGIIIFFISLAIISSGNIDPGYYRMWVSTARKFIEAKEGEEYIPALEKLTDEAENKKDASELRPFFNKVTNFEQVILKLQRKKQLLSQLDTLGEEMDDQRAMISALEEDAIKLRLELRELCREYAEREPGN